MGGCPCPRCTVAKENIPRLGTESDRLARSELARKDDEERREKVLDARALIYEDGYVVNAQKVDEILKDESLVPTVVRSIVHC